jgi:3',5'-cyclic AMP phosphodiesterase CpdA
MFRLAHLSDIHLGPLPDVSYRELISKRITGYINWRRNRRHSLAEDIIARLVADLRGFDADHVAVTGDLVNLALDKEIALARAWLEVLGNREHVTVVPGNHDAYVPGALDRVCTSWADYMRGDGDNQPLTRRDFPFLRIRGPVALIGLSSARASAPFMASGFFPEEQEAKARRMLDLTHRRGLFRVLLIHHPPVRGATATHKRLFGIRRFQKMVADHGAELVLHGHTHLPTTHWIAGPHTRVPVVGVAAAGQAHGSAKPAAQYNLIDIQGGPGHWHVGLTRRGIVSTTGDMADLWSGPLVFGADAPLIG